MKQILIILFLAVCSACSVPVSSPSESVQYKQISQQEAVKMMQEMETVIVDVRTPEEYAEGHIPLAVNLPLSDVVSRSETVLPDKDACLLVYCRSGNRSKQASEKLAELGYSRVFEFGGINTWTGDIEK